MGRCRSESKNWENWNERKRRTGKDESKAGMWDCRSEGLGKETGGEGLRVRMSLW